MKTILPRMVARAKANIQLEDDYSTTLDLTHDDRRLRVYTFKGRVIRQGYVGRNLERTNFEDLDVALRWLMGAKENR